MSRRSKKKYHRQTIHEIIYDKDFKDASETIIENSIMMGMNYDREIIKGYYLFRLALVETNIPSEYKYSENMQVDKFIVPRYMLNDILNFIDKDVKYCYKTMQYRSTVINKDLSIRESLRDLCLLILLEPIDTNKLKKYLLMLGEGFKTSQHQYKHLVNLLY